MIGLPTGEPERFERRRILTMAYAANRSGRRIGVMPRALTVTLLLCYAWALSGCTYFIALGYLISGPPSNEPEFDKSTNQSLTAKDVVVAVACYAPLDLRNRYAKLDEEIATYLSHRLNKHHIKVINPDRVSDWLDRNSDWDQPEEIGAAFNATHVIYIDLHEYSLFEENSSNLYRGRAEALVSVIEMDEDGEGDRIYSKEITSRYPLSMPRSQSEVTFSVFRRQYLSRLSEDIGRLFYEWYNGDDIPDAV
jgi:hypothetical protein